MVPHPYPCLLTFCLTLQIQQDMEIPACQGCMQSPNLTHIIANQEQELDLARPVGWGSLLLLHTFLFLLYLYQVISVLTRVHPVLSFVLAVTYELSPSALKISVLEIGYGV